MATTCQLSNPRNSENASPFGTRTLYLAWPASCAMTALPPRAASAPSETTATTTASIRLRFISALLSDRTALRRRLQNLLQLLERFRVLGAQRRRRAARVGPLQRADHR